MNDIILSLKSPSWWFTACLVAVVTSIMAGYLKDWLSLVLSRTSRYWRTRRLGLLRAQARSLCGFRRSETLLVLFGFRLLIAMGLYSMSMALAISAPILMDYYRVHPEVDPISAMTPQFLHRISPFICLPFAITGIVTGLGLPRRFSTFARGCRHIRQKYEERSK